MIYHGLTRSVQWVNFQAAELDLQNGYPYNLEGVSEDKGISNGSETKELPDESFFRAVEEELNGKTMEGA